MSRQACAARRAAPVDLIGLAAPVAPRQKNHCSWAQYTSFSRAYSLPGDPPKNCTPRLNDEDLV
jgi:hypothetical protein